MFFMEREFPSGLCAKTVEDGATVDEFLEWFPGVVRHQIEAVLEFATASLVKPVAV